MLAECAPVSATDRFQQYQKKKNTSQTSLSIYLSSLVGSLTRGAADGCLETGKNSQGKDHSVLPVVSFLQFMMNEGVMPRVHAHLPLSLSLSPHLVPLAPAGTFNLRIPFSVAVVVLISPFKAKNLSSHRCCSTCNPGLKEKVKGRPKKKGGPIDPVVRTPCGGEVGAGDPLNENAKEYPDKPPLMSKEAIATVEEKRENVTETQEQHGEEEEKRERK
eukprot:gene8816-6200_t